MDRQVVFQDQIPLVEDLLRQNRWAMIGLGWLAQTLFGTPTLIEGLGCTPTSPASMQVKVAPGAIYSLQNVDDSDYGSLAADTSHQIVKQGLSLDNTLLSCPAPATPGYSLNYLIQIGFQEVDTDPTLLAYFNPANVDAPLSGQGGSGQPDNIRRAAKCIIQAKAGVPALTGAQTTPAPDPGFTGAFVVTVANGQSTVVSANISQLASAPFLPAKLTTLPAAIQASTWISGPDVGAANAYVIQIKPQPAAYADGMLILTRAAHAGTGAATVAIQGLTTRPMLRPDGDAIHDGDIQAGQALALLQFQGAFYLLNPSITHAFNAWAKEQIQPSVAATSSYSTGYRCRPILLEPSPSTFDLGIGNIGYAIKHTDNSSQSTWRIPANADVPWPVGAVIWFQAGRGTAGLKISPKAGVSLYWGTSSGDRTLPNSAQCGIRYDGSDEWWVIDASGVT